jgi:uncharacterized protein YbjT (DUF2867 family)
MSAPTLVTGALGTIGRRVAVQLTENGRPVRAADLDPDAVREQFGPAVEAVRLDFTDPATWTAAFSGVQVMYLMRPPR